MTKLTNNAVNAFAAAHNARNAALAGRLRKSSDWWHNASPSEREAMHKAQRESFVRAMKPGETSADGSIFPDSAVKVPENIQQKENHDGKN
jgi:hypothetical protein